MFGLTKQSSLDEALAEIARLQGALETAHRRLRDEELAHVASRNAHALDMEKRAEVVRGIRVEAEALVAQAQAGMRAHYDALVFARQQRDAAESARASVNARAEKIEIRAAQQESLIEELQATIRRQAAQHEETLEKLLTEITDLKRRAAHDAA